MEINLQLRNNRGFRWVKKGSFYIKGYIYDLNEKLYLEEDLAEYFKGIRSYSDFEERVSYANGCFSVIWKKGDVVYAACDIIRAFPLFYKNEDDGWIITDDAIFLQGHIKKPEINQVASVEFLATGYVTGSETLVNDINQVQAGEIIRIENNELTKKFYYTYRISKPFETDYEEFRSEGIKIFNNAFKRFIASLKGRTVMVPLSGGFDSRMIAAMLKKYEYDKVICFTYGREGNPEVEVSRKVAEILGFKWIFVKYSDELINNYIEDKVFREYFQYAGNLVSMFFMQEYFAVRYLKDNNLIPEDSIFAPGHSGDFLGGSQLYKHGNLSINEDIGQITRRIYFVKYCNLRPKGSDKKAIIRRIEKTLEEKFTGNSALSYSVHEDWDFKEKLAKLLWET